MNCETAQKFYNFISENPNEEVLPEVCTLTLAWQDGLIYRN